MPIYVLVSSPVRVYSNSLLSKLRLPEVQISWSFVSYVEEFISEIARKTMVQDMQRTPCPTLGQKLSVLSVWLLLYVWRQTHLFHYSLSTKPTSLQQVGSGEMSRMNSWP